MTDRRLLLDTLEGYLDAHTFSDAAFNGLQIEGRREIRRILCSVTADLRSIQAAAEGGFDTLLVHHGLFWKGQSPMLVSAHRERFKALLSYDINLIAYHLPLDAHPVVGNNAMLCQHLGLIDIQPKGNKGDARWFYLARLPEPMTPQAFALLLESKLGRASQYAKGHDSLIQTLAICSGAAGSLFHEAIDSRVDAFITGEPLERAFYEASESGIHFYAAGHHATERLGVQALASWITQSFPDIRYQYFETHNPF